MAEAQSIPTPAVRTRSPKRKLWQDILSASIGFCIGTAFLVFVGTIASMDVLMPGRAINRNVNRTKMTVLDAMISGLFSKIAAVFGGADARGGGAGAATENLRQVRNGTRGASLLLTYNLSEALHADLLGQFHLPVIDYLSYAISNDTAMASNITDGARASGSEVADTALQEPNLTAWALANASDVRTVLSSTFVNQNSLKKADKSFSLDLKDDSNRADR